MHTECQVWDLMEQSKLATLQSNGYSAYSCFVLLDFPSPFQQKPAVNEDVDKCRLDEDKCGRCKSRWPRLLLGRWWWEPIKKLPIR